MCKHGCLLFYFFKACLILEKINATMKLRFARIMEELSAKEPLAVSPNLLNTIAHG